MSSSKSNNPVSITAHFSIPNDEGSSSEEVEQIFDATNCTPALVGLPVGVEPVKPKGGDYSYSGMHDHGPLPPAKEGGDFALLINMVKKAQRNSDELLTRVIKDEKTKNPGRKPDKNDTIKKKKQKLGE